MLRVFPPLILAAAVLFGQSAAGWKEFWVGPPTANRANYSRTGIRAEGAPLKTVLSKVFDVPEHRILGPDWLATTRYALTAQVDDPKNFQLLMQQELAARFHLLAHREVRQVPVFVLKQLDGGSKLPGTASPGPTTAMSGGLRMNGATTESFARALSDSIHRPVIDESGLNGTFDITLAWNADSLASVHAAVKQQLGMQLIEDQRTMELLIIDHIEKLEFR